MPTINLLVVDNPARWDIGLDSVTVISAKEYLSPSANQLFSQARVFNLCRSYSYQSIGYYVSLLAEARGHRAIPTVTTIRDFRLPPVARSIGEEFNELIQKALNPITENRFELDVYFGKSLDKTFEKLSSQVYRFFPAPLLRAQFIKQDKWILTSVTPRTLSRIPDQNREAIISIAQDFFKRKSHIHKQPKQRYLYDLAVLVNPDEEHSPSDPEALDKFKRAANEVGFYAETITTNDSDRISEFDALFIRETTAVDHPTYRLSRLAHAEGLIVVDDPWSILRCANKIYLAELLTRLKIPSPETWILSKTGINSEQRKQIPYPCILKSPDTAFSTGVVKVENEQELDLKLNGMFKSSELVLAQRFMPSEFDWRIGVLDHRPLFACKYFMAKDHWQIYNWQATSGESQAGESQTVHVEFAPSEVIETALRATASIGDGLYGVDLKQIGNRVVVIEVNDNPSIDSGVEDKALGMELYRRLARSFRQRIERARL